MTIYQLTDDVIFAIHAEHSNVEIGNFWEVARLIGHKVRKKLEASSGDVSPVRKLNILPRHSDSIGIQQFVQRVWNISNSNVCICRNVQSVKCCMWPFLTSHA